MTIEEKTRKTLTELGVESPEEINKLFAEVGAALERQAGQWKADTAGKNPDDQLLRLKVFRNHWLGRNKGLRAQIDANWLKQAQRELKPAVGARFNEFLSLAGSMFSDLVRQVTSPRPPAAEASLGLDDLTLPGYRRPLGSIHPVTQAMREIEDIFLGLGFWIESGPEIESVYYNFDALNIPESHPARDDWDTLYVDAGIVLRTHTSPVQIRAMEKHGAPLHIICPGKCYRRDNPDSTHAMMFHQVEGLAVDTDITFADLKGTLEFFTKRFFGETVKTSFHPSFFPFTEPSAEVSISCVFCRGEGCGVCKMSGWLEVMGCGMVHPEVLRHGRIDPERYSGWAFGLGVERFAMIKYNINDIQLFYQSDVRFLEQF